MSGKLSCKHTIFACYAGYITQAIVNNLSPLLFVIFRDTFNLPLSEITLLITINFLIQLCVDCLSAVFVDKIGYRKCIVAAHVFAVAGLASLAILPFIMPPFAGLLVSVFLYAVGGGLIEVLISPIVEACPTDNKASVMSLLHSFYCWGTVAVILLSTLFLTLAGRENWRILALLWAVFPLVNAVFFTKVPIAPLTEEGEGMKTRELFKSGLFWIFVVLMMAAGASEQAMSQWASAFAEKGLGVTKTVGDLAGPMAFACLMGISRAFYGKFGHKIELDKFMNLSCILCIASYLAISLVPNSVVGLIGCALCGLSVGIMWPGSFSKASASIKRGGTALFALLALGGDLGCTAGPTLVGFVSGRLNDNMRMGILVGTIFPILLLLGIYLCKKEKARSS